MAAALLTLLLGLLVFATAKEMLGSIPAFIALTLLVFEPNILAHGAMVTTDVGFSCFLLATVYAFYSYLKKPGVGRLVLTGLGGRDWASRPALGDSDLSNSVRAGTV